MNAYAQLARAASELVNRANAGDQNARATIQRVALVARSGRSQRAMITAAFIDKYARAYKGNFVLCPNKPSWKRVSTKKAKTPRAVFAGVMSEPDKGKKPVPMGLLGNVREVDKMVPTIAKASKYRYGLNSAALVLANGPILTKETLVEIGNSCFGSDLASETYLLGVKDPNAWRELAPKLDPTDRLPLAVGQCVGKALRIQAIRGEGCPMSTFDPVIGWELGE